MQMQGNESNCASTKPHAGAIRTWLPMDVILGQWVQNRTGPNGTLPLPQGQEFLGSPSVWGLYGGGVPLHLPGVDESESSFGKFY